jgi:uncharacterized RDD family membrane protein YckC
LSVAEPLHLRAPAAPAPLGSRLAALVLDWLVAFILGCVFLVAAGLYLLVVSDMGYKDASDQAIGVALIVVSLTVPIWLVVTLAGYTWHGRSVGKLAMNLRVVDRSGEPPNLWRSIVRLLVYAFEVAPLTAIAPVAGLALVWRSTSVLTQLLVALGVTLIVPALSVLLMVRDRSRRSLHDFAAGTTVIAD